MPAGCPAECRAALSGAERRASRLASLPPGEWPILPPEKANASAQRRGSGRETSGGVQPPHASVSAMPFMRVQGGICFQNTFLFGYADRFCPALRQAPPAAGTGSRPVRNRNSARSLTARRLRSRCQKASQPLPGYPFRHPCRNGLSHFHSLQRIGFPRVTDSQDGNNIYYQSNYILFQFLLQDTLDFSRK